MREEKRNCWRRRLYRQPGGCGKGRESVGGEIWNIINCFIVLCKCNARNINYNVISSAFYYYPVVMVCTLASHTWITRFYNANLQNHVPYKY